MNLIELELGERQGLTDAVVQLLRDAPPFALLRINQLAAGRLQRVGDAPPLHRHGGQDQQRRADRAQKDLHRQHAGRQRGRDERASSVHHAVKGDDGKDQQGAAQARRTKAHRRPEQQRQRQVDQRGHGGAEHAGAAEDQDAGDHDGRGQSCRLGPASP